MTTTRIRNRRAGEGNSTIDNRESTVLAVHSGALGDCILFGHLLSRIDGQVTLAAGGAKGRLLAGAGVVHRALDFNALPMHEVFSDRPLGECRLPELLGVHERLISCFAGGNRRAELRLGAMCSAATAAFLPTRPPDHFRGHLLDLWSDMLGMVPHDPKGHSPWRIPEPWRERAARALRDASVDPQSEYVVVHPGAGAEEKRWPLERFADLGERLEGVVFVLGAVEIERFPPERTRVLKERFPVLSCPELEVLAGVLTDAAAFVGNDGGAAHLAAAAGAPTLTLFGPSRPEHFAPLGSVVKVLAADPIEKITTDQVLEALATLRG